MKRTTIFAALISAALLISLLGCGDPAIGKLQTITLTASGSGTGFAELKGEGGTVQLIATGNYSSGGTRDLSGNVTYVVTPVGTSDSGAPLQMPPLTMTVSNTGLATAVAPFVCSFVNVQSDPTKPAAWALDGSYQIVATFKGVTSQPVFLGVASAAGNSSDGSCGPS